MISSLRHFKGFAYHPSGSRRQRIAFKVRAVDPCDVDDVASGDCSVAGNLAEIIEHHEVVFRLARLIEIYAFKYFDQIKHADIEPCFFSQFAPYAFDERLAKLEHAARNRPLALERRIASLNQ